MNEKLIEIARNIGAIGRYNDKSDVLIIMTSDQLHAYTEQVCRPLVEALQQSRYGMHQDIEGERCMCSECDIVRLRNAALSTHRAIMGDKK